ncbi:MAG: hypothetical protein WDN75_09060 [Bacteroidota bacterium]
MSVSPASNFFEKLVQARVKTFVSEAERPFLVRTKIALGFFDDIELCLIGGVFDPDGNPDGLPETCLKIFLTVNPFKVLRRRRKAER